MQYALLCAIGCLQPLKLHGQSGTLETYNIKWSSQSKNSGESMPCGGGDIGLNVWVENDELLFYISKSGTFDENNAFLKLGRVRIKLTPNPFERATFRQELVLQEGGIKITGNNKTISTRINLWVDAFRPVIHVDINSNNLVSAEVQYESWRDIDRELKGKENNANSYKWAKREVKTYRDDISFVENGIQFYHQNKNDASVFDVTVHQQGLDSIKSQLFNPLYNLTFGGTLQGKNMKPAGTSVGKYLDTSYKAWKLQSKTAAKSQSVSIYLHTAQVASIDEWRSGLHQHILEAEKNESTAAKNTKQWWKKFWDRSFIYINPDQAEETSSTWQAGRNYQLFRYMLGCNALGECPTKFNGGLFTYDPSLIDSTLKFTPDHRNWGGGTMTAQNQRLVYFPMLKSGDIDMMKPQFDFYKRSLRNAELRSEIYWKHEGACFTEQIENFGLPNCSEYGWNRSAIFDSGVEYNSWLEYEWDTCLEFCLMILETERYASKDISTYMPLIESCLTFFNEHYQYLASRRGSKIFDGNNHLVLYPGSGCETYKMAYNSTSTIAGLQTILTRLLDLPASYLSDEKRKLWTTMLSHIPPISFHDIEGHKTIAPALHWERINNTESPQLYPVFPWGMYGVGKSELDIAKNTYLYDSDVIKFKSYVGWKQHNIFAARLGLTKEASELTVSKLKDSGRRFPAFWGPGFDWTPDHNWGGSGMIGLQEMLLQTDNEKIFLFPAWPKEWNVHFKLHAPYNTVIEGELKNGTLKSLNVSPESRRKDIINLLDNVTIN